MGRILFALFMLIAAPTAALESGATCDAEDSDALWKIIQDEQTQTSAPKPRS